MLKSLAGVAIFVGTSALLGRGAMVALLGLVGIGVRIVHAWWLPRNGVNGWTAEPRDRYHALIGVTEKPVDH